MLSQIINIIKIHVIVIIIIGVRKTGRRTYPRAMVVVVKMGR
jgi:hypothetical protein